MARNDRDDAGKSEASWKKHELFHRIAGGQLNAFRYKHSAARIALVDFNAGDGEGVMRGLQLDLFASNISLPTPAIAMKIANGHDRIILCEKKPDNFSALKQKFPIATVVENHSLAINYLNGCDFALVFSDGCGTADLGFEHLEKLATHIRSDFIIAFNEGWIKRVNGTKSDRWATARTRYGWMSNYPELRERLRRKYIAVTPRLALPPIRSSPNFNYRMLLIANGLCDAARRHPFEVLS